MNLRTALETMQLASTLDAKLEISALLERAIDSLSNLALSPSEPTLQANAETALQNLAVNLRKIDGELSDADAKRLEYLGASELFPSDLHDRIIDQFPANIAGPSVGGVYVQEIVNTRNTILAAFNTVLGVAKTQKWDRDDSINLDTEIGFSHVDAAFDNDVSGLPKHLDWIQRFMLAWKTPAEISQSRADTRSNTSPKSKKAEQRNMQN